MAKRIDPKPRPTNAGPVYMNVNPMTTPQMQNQQATLNLGTALRFKNSLKGVNQNLVNSTDLLAGQGLQDLGGIGGSGSSSNYVQVDPMALQRADSVINASRSYLYGGQPSRNARASIRGAKNIGY